MKIMKKNWNYKVLGILIFFLLTGICLIRPIRVEAAGFKTIYPEVKKEKVGKYYLWSYDSGGNNYKVYASTSKKGKGKVIAKNITGCSDILTDGNVVYYPVRKPDGAYVYSVKMNGKNRKLVGKLKDGLASVSVYYDGKIYFRSAGNGTLCLDLKSKKWKWIRKDAQPNGSFGEYLFLTRSYHADGAKYIFNCRTEKSVKISDLPGSVVGVASGKVYFTERVGEKRYHQGYSHLLVKTCSLDGKNLKTFMKLSGGNYGTIKITSKYMYYSKFDKSYNYKYYRYNIKTKKTKKITGKTFYNAIK